MPSVSHAWRGKRRDDPDWTQLMLTNNEAVQHVSSIHHSQCQRKPDEFDQGWRGLVVVLDDRI
jgi:hypothetical protein